jgi:hypothetical protein
MTITDCRLRAGKKGEWKMELMIKGKNVEVTDRLRDYVEKKIGRLDR